MAEKKKEKTFKEDAVMMLLEQVDNGVGVIAESQQEIQKDVVELRAEFKQGMADVKEELSEIKFTLKRKVDYDEFKKLEKRVLRLERTRV